VIINARFKISEERNCTAIFAYGRQPGIKEIVPPSLHMAASPRLKKIRCSEGGHAQFKTYFDISARDQLTLVRLAGGTP